MKAVHSGSDFLLIKLNKRCMLVIDVHMRDYGHLSMTTVFVAGIMGYRLLHWGPVLALSVTAIISWSSFICLLERWPITSPAAVLNLVMFFLWHILILYNFLLAIFVGPGYVPLGWKPVSNFLNVY